MGKKTQCTLLSKEFGFQQISLNKVLSEKSHDYTYLHAQYVKDCLAENVDVATELAIDLLGRKINEVNTWTLVLGFPERIEQLVEFEKKVGMAHANRALLMLVGSKDKLHIAAELLIRANAPACRKAGIFRWS